jgi:hypothetical protein
VKTVRLFWVAPIVLLLASSQLFAQSGNDDRVQKLEEAVRVLERRVADLEERLRERTASAPVASDKANWRKLQRGMSERGVEKLLGSPTKIDASSVFQTVWYYGDPVGGSVKFDANSRKVVAWREP